MVPGHQEKQKSLENPGFSHCRRQDLNLHSHYRNQALNLARLPIPPLRLTSKTTRTAFVHVHFRIAAACSPRPVVANIRRLGGTSSSQCPSLRQTALFLVLAGERDGEVQELFATYVDSWRGTSTETPQFGHLTFLPACLVLVFSALPQEQVNEM